MVEVSNINPQTISKSDVTKYNKEVTELQESIKQLNNLQSALESRINLSDNTIVSSIIGQIESTRQFALKTIENGQINNESNKAILRDSYETIQTLLKENRKEFVINNNNQIVTLKEILNDYREEQKQEKKQEEQKRNDVKYTIGTTGNELLNDELVKGAKSAGSLLNELATGTQLGMAVQTAYKPVKYLYSMTKSLTKGILGTGGSVGNMVHDMFNLPSKKDAKSLEKEKAKAEIKRDKDTTAYRQKVLSKLDDMTTEIKKVDASGSSEGMGWFGKIAMGLLAAGGGTLIWSLFGDQIKGFIKDKVIDPVNTYIHDNHPELAKTVDRSVEVAQNTASVLTGKNDRVNSIKKAYEEQRAKMDYEYDNHEWLDVEKDDWAVTAGAKGFVNGVLDALTWIPRKAEHLTKKYVNYVEGKTMEALTAKEEITRHDPNFTTDPRVGKPFVEGDNMEDNIRNYMLSKGKDPVHVAGVMGNIKQESSYNPRAENNLGYKGLFQMDPKDRWPKFVQWAEKNNRDPYDYKAQIDYMDVEEGERNWDWLNSATTPEDAAYLWNLNVERSGEVKKINRGSDRFNQYNQNREREAIRQFSLMREQPSIKSADIESLKLASNQSRYDMSSQEAIINNTNEANAQQFTTLFGNMNNSLANGFSSVTNAINNQSLPNLATNIDDPGMTLINSGGA